MFDFDSLEPQEFEFQFRGETYVIKEATVDQGAQFRNRQARAAKFQDGELSGVEGIADAEVWFAGECLHLRKGGRDVPVTGAALRKWPQRTWKPVYEKARELSGMKDEEDNDPEFLRKRIKLDTKRLRQLERGEGSLKNSPGSTEDGSSSAENGAEASGSSAGGLELS